MSSFLATILDTPVHPSRLGKVPSVKKPSTSFRAKVLIDTASVYLCKVYRAMVVSVVRKTAFRDGPWPRPTHVAFFATLPADNGHKCNVAPWGPAVYL
jgi:hypothetical protein